MVFLDITASFEGRKTFAELVKRIAANISIPFTVGGGIHELSDVDRLLNAGADKISVNSSAIRRPGLIDEIAKHFGSQVCVLAVDAKQTEKGWWCFLNGGRVETDKELFAWTKEAQERGAGEVLFTSSLSSVLRFHSPHRGHGSAFCLQGEFLSFVAICLNPKSTSYSR